MYILSKLSYYKLALDSLCLYIFLFSQVYAAGDSLVDFTPSLDTKFVKLLKNTDPAKGEPIFMRKCSSCHEHEKTGTNWKGPKLWNLFGRKAGTVPGFEYSEAMSNSGHTWNYATLNYYLTRTDRAVPGRLMNFRGIKKDKLRARLIRFLSTLNDTPQPIPE